MRNRNIFLLITLAYLIGFIAHFGILHKSVYGDGIFYYSWLRSSVIDQDILFENEYNYFGVHQPVTQLGLIGNKYSIGPAALWYPWYIWTHLLVRGTGYEQPYQVVVGLSGVLYALAGLVLLYSLLIRYFSKAISLSSILCIAFATNLLFYGSIDTVNSHAVSFFACVVFLSFLYQPVRNWLRIGMALGLVALIRPQDGIVGILALAYMKPKDSVRFFLGALYAFVPQLIIWQILNGTFISSPYISTIEGFNFFQPHILGVLFSVRSGLLLWTPVVFIGFAGFWIKSTVWKYKAMGILFILQLYIVASWSVWWQGASYSSRMFVGTLPIIAFGIAHFFEKATGHRMRSAVLLYAITIPLCMLNVLSIGYFLATH